MKPILFCSVFLALSEYKMDNSSCNWHSPNLFKFYSSEYFSVCVSLGYTLVGQVESVGYYFDIEYPKPTPFCHIAVNDPTSERSLIYQSARREQMCTFAENCKKSGIPVKVEIINGEIHKIEYGTSKAIWPKMWSSFLK